MEHNLSEFTNSCSSCSVTHYYGIPLNIYREDTSFKPKTSNRWSWSILCLNLRIRELHRSVVRCCISLESRKNYAGEELLSKKNTKQVIMTQNLSESTISWTTSFSCSLLHGSGIYLTLCREDTPLKERHQAGDDDDNDNDDDDDDDGDDDDGGVWSVIPPMRTTVLYSSPWRHL